MKTACAALLLFAAALPARAAEPSGTAPHALTRAERDARLGEFRPFVERRLKSFEKQMARPDATPPERDLPNAAYIALMLGREPAEAEKFLDLAFEQQDMDPKSKDYGSVPWQIGHPEIRDANAIEFTCQPVGPILIEFGDKLSPEFKRRLEPHLKASFAAMNRRRLAVSYTNIWLMRTVDMVLLGQAIHDSAAEDEGYKQLDQWIDYTRKAGIHEFDSNTYYAVDLDSLNVAYKYASREGAKAKFKAILDYFWTDIAADTFAANAVLSGPMSRNYGFLTSQGGIDPYLWIEGLRQQNDMHSPDLSRGYLIDTAGPQCYHPDATILARANEPERVVRSRWDEAAGRDRYAYFTPDFVLGSASGDYGEQDKLVTLELAGTMVPVATMIPDRFDSPYGTVKTPDGSGHNKPKHLRYRPMCVQEKGNVLMTGDLQVAGIGETSSLAMNILLPLHADELVVDGKPLGGSTTQPFEASVKPECVIGFRQGKTGVAIRILDAASCGGGTARTMLKLDPEGIKTNVLRYVAYAYQGAPRKLTDPHLPFAALIVARRCENADDFQSLLRDVARAGVTDRKSADRWTLAADLPGARLEITRATKNGQLLARRVNGAEISFPPLSVNNQAIELLP